MLTPLPGLLRRISMTSTKRPRDRVFRVVSLMSWRYGEVARVKVLAFLHLPSSPSSLVDDDDDESRNYTRHQRWRAILTRQHENQGPSIRNGNYRRKPHPQERERKERRREHCRTIRGDVRIANTDPRSCGYQIWPEDVSLALF